MVENADASDPFGDFVRLIAGPLAGGIRSVEQMRHAADELVRGVETFNRTMENLNATVERMNRLLDDIEGPTRALLPQVDRTVKTVDDLTSRISDLPIDPSELVNAIVELSRRLGPLAQMAESASGMFGLRIPGLGAASGSDRPAASSPTATKPTTTKKTGSTSKTKPAKKTAAKATAKRTSATKRSTSSSSRSKTNTTSTKGRA